MSNYCKECYKKQEQIEQLQAENEKLNKMTGIFSARLCEKYRQALQEIRDILAERIEWTGIPNNAEIEIIDKINSVIGVE